LKIRGFEDPVTIKVKAPEPNNPPKTYLDATKQYSSKVTLNPDGVIEGYVAGFPFPDPKEPNLALKIMWNQYYRWLGDDYIYPNGLVTSSRRKGGKVAWGNAQWSRIRFSGRTDIAPMPSLKNPDDLFFAFHLLVLTPPSKDLEQLIYRYNDPQKQDNMWGYIPTLRRTLRLVSSERANPILGTTKTWDDLFGFDGRVIDFDYEIMREQQTLACVNETTVRGDPEVGGFLIHPIFSFDPYETRDVVIVKIVPKDPRYPNSHRFLWIPKDTYYVIYTETFDKSANFWKGMMNCFNKVETEHGDTGPFLNSSSAIDFKTQYWINSVFDKVLINSGLPKERFALGEMGFH